MHPRKLASLTNMPGPDRYEYFVTKVCDFEVVWGLFDEGWATGNAQSKVTVPVWPEEELAAHNAVGDWNGCTPRAIPLSEFVEKWIPGAVADDRMFAVFPTREGKAVVVEPGRLLLDLNEERELHE